MTRPRSTSDQLFVALALVLSLGLDSGFVLHDESTRPDFVKADAVVETRLMEGLAEIQHMASQIFVSWNRVDGWLQAG